MVTMLVVAGVAVATLCYAVALVVVLGDWWLALLLLVVGEEWL